MNENGILGIVSLLILRKKNILLIIYIENQNSLNLKWIHPRLIFVKLSHLKFSYACTPGGAWNILDRNMKYTLTNHLEVEKHI